MPTKKTTRKNKQRVLVTGGAGFIGSHLVDRLIAEGFSVAVIDDLSNGRKEYLHLEARLYPIPLGSPKLDAVFAKEKPAAVFHLAAHIDAHASVDDPLHDAEINIHGALRLLKACMAHGVRRFVYASSGGAIHHGAATFPTPETEPPTPRTPYGVSKLAFEYYLQAARAQSGPSYAVLRYANVYGPRQDQKGEGGVIGIFCKLLRAGKTPVIFGSGHQTRDFVYVDDIVEANMKAFVSPKDGTWNIATGRETSVRRLAELTAVAFGWKKPFGRGPAAAGDVARSCLDPRRTRKELGWSPKVSIEDGIRRTAEWFKAKR